MDTATGQNTPRALVYTTRGDNIQPTLLDKSSIHPTELARGAGTVSQRSLKKRHRGLSVFVSASFKSCATPPPAHPVLQAD